MSCLFVINCLSKYRLKTSSGISINQIQTREAAGLPQDEFVIVFFCLDFKLQNIDCLCKLSDFPDHYNEYMQLVIVVDVAKSLN